MKNNIVSLTISLLLILGLNTQCESPRTRAISQGISVTGNIGEILVVCENDIWNSDLQECLDTNLVQWILPYLPDVATFELIHKSPNQFTQGVKRYRNTLFVTVDPNHKGEHAVIEKRLDVWAEGQIVVDIIGKNYKQIEEACKLGLDEVHDIYDDASWRRIMDNYRRVKHTKIRNKIKKNFGIDVAIPEGSRLVSKRTNFFRVEFPEGSKPIEFVGSGREDVGTVASGIMIYQYNYTDSTQFAFQELLNARDTMLKYNAPYEIEGMYMGTQYSPAVYPEGNDVTNASGTIDGFEMRGMYMFKGLPKHAPGGAFWAYHFVNPETQKLICISGYVYAPPTASWTQPLREVQATLRSVEIEK